VDAFQNIGWEYSAMGQPIGIKKGEIRDIIWLLGIPESDKTKIFHGLKVMEHAALTSIRERDNG